MEKLSLEVYSSQTNCAVIRPPGRRFPGVVIQGDSLASLCDDANDVAIAIRDGRVDDDTRAAMQMVLARLVGSLLLYQCVLSAHGMELPFAPNTSADFATVYVEPPPSEPEARGLSALPPSGWPSLRFATRPQLAGPMTSSSAVAFAPDG